MEAIITLTVCITEFKNKYYQETLQKAKNEERFEMSRPIQPVFCLHRRRLWQVRVTFQWKGLTESFGDQSDANTKLTSAREGAFQRMPQVTTIWWLEQERNASFHRRAAGVWNEIPAPIRKQNSVDQNMLINILPAAVAMRQRNCEAVVLGDIKNIIF